MIMTQCQLSFSNQCTIKCTILVGRDCGSMPMMLAQFQYPDSGQEWLSVLEVLAVGLGPVYLSRLWGIIHPMSMLSLTTAPRPSYLFWPARSRPLSGQNVLATWAVSVTKIYTSPASVNTSDL